MASISKDPNGRRTIQFIAGDNKRRSIRLGKVPQRYAEAVKLRVESLVAASITRHALDDETARWLANLDQSLADKLAAVGLTPKREAATLKSFIDGYIALRTDAKPNTHIHFKRGCRELVEFFGPDRNMRDITAGDAEEYRLYLTGKRKLAENTARRIIGRAKQFFRAALKRRLILENPFADLQGTTMRANREREYFITRDEAEKVIAACPDSQWKLLFALSRYGGLRCPSEHLALTWADVNWEHGRLTVPSPKTEHHEGHESRVLPIFPELRKHLEAVFDEAEPGTVHVITRYRERNANLRTQLNRIIRKAGLKPWPKLFHNLRSTRETELAETFPLHVVCSWIGNSQPVAMKHYLQVTDEHYATAQEAVQNPVQQAHEVRRIDSQAERRAHEKTPALQGFATRYETVRIDKVPPVGLEPTT